MDDFRDFVAELVRAKVRFLIVGAHALGVHGVPRATKDLDIWVESSPDNARRTCRALVVFGAPMNSINVSEADFLRPDMVVQLGLPPYRIDIMTSVSGVSFEDAWNGRVEDVFQGVPAPFIGRAEFIRNKLASGRTKDRADVESLGEE